MVNVSSVANFQAVIRDYYCQHARPMPWRNISNPYYVYVSEVMLQQTQVSRVITRYPSFISRFPTIESLASASSRDLLAAWQGMGYNRRALNMGRAAKVMHTLGGVPQTYTQLLSLPGIGEATAGAILAYAFNMPVVFIETNIRRVFIHFFFHNQVEVADKEILPIIKKSLPKDNPREWYYALTDYGAMLPKVVANPNRRSQAYRVQPPFEGSHRALRGAIIRSLVAYPQVTPQYLCEQLPTYSPTEIEQAVTELTSEGMVRHTGRGIEIAE